MTNRCIICGDEVTPATGVILGAFGRPISVAGRGIVYHHGRCTELVHGGARAAVRGVAKLLARRAPRVFGMLAAASEVAALRRGAR